MLLDETGIKQVLKSWAANNVVPSEWLVGIGEKLRKIATIADNFKSKTAEAEKGGAYTYQGLDELRLRIGTEALRDLAKIESETMPVLEKRIELAKADLKFDKPPTDAVLDFLIQREIRDRLQGMDSAVIYARYIEAAIDGSDPALEKAVENWPPSFQPLTTQQLAKGREERAKRQFPDKVFELQALEDLLSLYRGAISGAKQELPQPQNQAEAAFRFIR
jgi:hypothetical protein